jgi:hypothetical protein
MKTEWKGAALVLIAVCATAFAAQTSAEPRTSVPQADLVSITVDGANVVNVLRGGLGASWHAMETLIPYGVKHPVFTSHSHGGSGWGAYPPAEDEQAWQQIYRHADWLGLDWNRVEVEQRIYEPERDVFTFDSPEMRILYRILDWHQQRGAEVFFQQMWCNVPWLAYPEFRDDPVERVHSAPVDLDAFADGLATLMEHLIKKRGYTCIKWLCITNEPGAGFSWWQAPPNQPLAIGPGLAAVRKALDQRGLTLPLSGPDTTTGFPAEAPGDIDYLDLLGAYDFHDYGADFDFRTKGHIAAQVRNAARWAALAHGAGKPLFLSEFGTMAYGWLPDKPGPGSPPSVLAGSELVVRLANVGVDGFNRWSFLNRGDLDGQWQLVDSWDPQAKKLLTDFPPHPNSYFCLGLLSRFTAKHSAILASQVDGGRIAEWQRVFAAAFRSPAEDLTLALVNDAPTEFPVKLTVQALPKPQRFYRYRYGEAQHNRADATVNPEAEFSLTLEAAEMKDTLPATSLTIYSTYKLEHDAPGVIVGSVPVRAYSEAPHSITTTQAATGESAKVPVVTLARGGQAQLAIYVVDPDGQLMAAPDPKSKRAMLGKVSLEDLRVYLGKLGGATFEVRAIPAYPGTDQPGIYVGLDKHLKFPEIDGSRQQYGLRTTPGKQLLIAGADDRGVSHGIYALLHRLGCRWYFPGDLWAVTPPVSQTLEVALDQIGGPDFYLQRRIWPGHGLRTPTTSRELGDWQRRNGIAQPFDMAISHSWIGLDPKADFETHPEWFALAGGQRQASKPCYSHPQVIAKAIDYALKHFEQNPGSGMVSVSAPDGLGYCTCDLCKKQAKIDDLEELQGVFFGKQPDGQLVSITSETIFHLANQVARAVAAQYPGKRVGLLAYSAYAHPPSFKLEPNIYVELTAGYRRTPLNEQEQMTLFGQRASALGVYEYFDVEQWSWERPGKARATQLDKVQSTIRSYYDNRFRSLSGESSDNFAPNGLGYYVITRLLWDTKQDVRRIEQEFYRDCFGPAAEPIQRLYRRWESDQAFDPRALAPVYRDLGEAAKLTEGQQSYRDRVDRLRMYAHFLKLWLQPPGNYDPKSNGATTWAKAHDTPAQRQQIENLGIWASRLIDTHMIHHAFNRYLLAGAQALGMDTTAWRQAAPIPTAAEVERVFQADLAEL